MEKYFVVIEKTETGFSAFSPDVPGCMTVGKTVESTIVNMREALELYMETATEEGQDLPALKSIEQHIQNGLLKDGEIADEYFLTQIEIESPAMAESRTAFITF